MSLGYFLILAILILGGVIATLGDRIGTKVGKARLSLFNLRPKKTAALITILMGVLISASTMGLLLLVSRGLRDQLFNFEKIRRELKASVEKSRSELQQANQDITKVQTELEQAREARVRSKEQLDRINQSLKGALSRQRETEAQRQTVENQRNQIQSQFVRVSEQANGLRNDIGKLRQEREILATNRNSLIQERDRIAGQIGQRDAEIARRNRELAQRDRDIATRDKVIAQRETRLQELEQQRIALQDRLGRLEDEFQNFREGVPIIIRNQTLSMAVVSARNPMEARDAIDAMLAQANRFAITQLLPSQATQPGLRLVQIDQGEIDRLLRQLADGQPYVVRVSAAANYFQGDTFPDQRGVGVFIEVLPNRLVYNAGDVVAAQRIDAPNERSITELQEWMSQLINIANLNAKRQGLWVSSSRVSLPSAQAVVATLKESNIPAEVRVIAVTDTMTAGPLTLEFEVLQGGEVVLRTGQLR